MVYESPKLVVAEQQLDAVDTVVHYDAISRAAAATAAAVPPPLPPAYPVPKMQPCVAYETRPSQ